MFLNRLGRGGGNRELSGKWKNNTLSALSPTWERCFSPQLDHLEEESWLYPLAENLSFTYSPSKLFGYNVGPFLSSQISSDADRDNCWLAALSPHIHPLCSGEGTGIPAPFLHFSRKIHPLIGGCDENLSDPIPYSNTSSHLFFPRSHTSHRQVSGPVFAYLEIFLFLTATQGTGTLLQLLTGLSNSPGVSQVYKKMNSVSLQKLETQISVPQAKDAQSALTSPLWRVSLELTETRRVQEPLASALARASCSCR